MAIADDKKEIILSYSFDKDLQGWGCLPLKNQRVKHSADKMGFKQGAGALACEYWVKPLKRFSLKQGTFGLVKRGITINRKSPITFDFWIYSTLTSRIEMYLKEKDGSTYGHGSNIKPNEWQNIVVATTDFTSEDIEGKDKLDIDQISEIWLIDFISSFLCKTKTKAKFMVDDFKIISGEFSLPIPYQSEIENLFEKEKITPKNLNQGKLGLVVMPFQDMYNKRYLTYAYKIAKNLGVGVISHFYNWKDIEPSSHKYNLSRLETTFNIMAKEKMDFEHALCFGPLRPGILDLPKEIKFRSFSDKKFIERYCQTLSLLLDRYGKYYSYYIEGTEVNIYLNRYPHQLKDYLVFLKAVKEAVKKKQPDIKFGVEIKYFAPWKDKTKTHIIEELAKISDILAISFYPQEWDKDPKNIGKYLEDIFKIAPDKPVVFPEAGWSSSEKIGSSEDLQALYIKEFFACLDKYKEKILFAANWGLYDHPHDAWLAGLTMTYLGMLSPDAIEYLTGQITTIGLIDQDGKPKKAFYEWIKEAKKFYEKTTQ